MREVKSGRAQFTQTVTSPDGAKKKTSSGSFEFARPNRFRFAYTKPFEQTIVADGQKVWIYDADLNQVSSRKLSAAIGATRPAALLAGGNLEKDFELSPPPAADGLEWTAANPSEGRQLRIAEGGLPRQRNSPRWRSSTASASARCCSSASSSRMPRPRPMRSNSSCPKGPTWSSSEAARPDGTDQNAYLRPTVHRRSRGVSFCTATEAFRLSRSEADQRSPVPTQGLLRSSP